MTVKEIKDGWHVTAGCCVYVKNGMVIKYHKVDDIEANSVILDQPVALNTFRVSDYRRRKKEKLVNE